MKIGVIGYGVVGQACCLPFKDRTELTIIDPKHSHKTIEDITDEELIFVCLPAPTLADGSVDASLIYATFSRLCDRKYNGLVVLKSTLPPDITRRLYEEYAHEFNLKNHRIRYIYSPEFITEANWENDALYPSRIIVAGNWKDVGQLETYYYRKFSSISDEVEFMDATYEEASLVKYAANAYLATKVVWMNQFKELFNDINGSDITVWDYFTRLLSSDPRIGNSHLGVPGPDGKYGYGGSCFPKDVKALTSIDTKGRLTVLREAELVNTQLRLKNK